MTSEPGSYSLNAEIEHRLLRLLSVTTLNLALLHKRLDRPESFSAEQAQEIMARIAQTHREMVTLLQAPR